MGNEIRMQKKTVLLVSVCILPSFIICVFTVLTQNLIIMSTYKCILFVISKVI